jgi:hypothetical protein
MFTVEFILFASVAVSLLRECDPAAAAQWRPRSDLDLSAYAVAACRIQLPSSADMLDLW